MSNPADKVERWAIDRLVPYARNARTHSDEQVAQIAASIKEWGWTTPILVDETGGIIAGHGRTMAAQRLKMTTVPVMVATGWSEAKKRASTHNQDRAVAFIAKTGGGKTTLAQHLIAEGEVKWYVEATPSWKRSYRALLLSLAQTWALPTKAKATTAAKIKNTTTTMLRLVS